MQWVWLHPYMRRKGCLTRAWPIFAERFGQFDCEPPLSDAMQTFLEKPAGSTDLEVEDNGRLWVDSDDNTINILTDFSVPTWTPQTAASTIVTADPTFTLQNTDEEDSDSGRQSRFIGKGEQSGGELTTLGFTEFSHDGSSDDEKGKWRVVLNSGSEGNSPTNVPIEYTADGKIKVSISLSVLDEDDLASNGDKVLVTQQSVKAYVDLDSTGSAMHDAENGFNNVDVDGTKTKVYTKYFTGTFDAASTKNVAHGIADVDKILHVSTAVFTTNTSNYIVHTTFSAASSTIEIQVRFDGTNVIFTAIGSTIQSQKFRIKIDYIL